jgi:hypothetical protein
LQEKGTLGSCSGSRRLAASGIAGEIGMSHANFFIAQIWQLSPMHLPRGHQSVITLVLFQQESSFACEHGLICEKVLSRQFLHNLLSPLLFLSIGMEVGSHRKYQELNTLITDTVEKGDLWDIEAG